MSSTIAREPSSADWGPPSPLFGEFLDHLRSAGLSEKKISDATGQARHFLVWLQEVGGEIETIDDDVMRHFRDHECRCPRPVTTTQLTQRSLARFAEQFRPLSHPLECGSVLHEVCHSCPEFCGTGHWLSFGWDEADISTEIDGRRFGGRGYSRAGPGIGSRGSRTGPDRA